MTQDPLEAAEIERVDPPESDRTEERDAAADWIESEVVDAGRWPMTLTAMEQETEWSRQHLRNCLDLYFKPVGHSNTGRMPADTQEMNREGFAIPGHERELLEAYRMGYRDGFQDANEQQ